MYEWKASEQHTTQDVVLANKSESSVLTVCLAASFQQQCQCYWSPSTSYKCMSSPLAGEKCVCVYTFTYTYIHTHSLSGTEWAALKGHRWRLGLPHQCHGLPASSCSAQLSRQALCCCHAPNIYVHLNSDSFRFWHTPQKCFTNKCCLLNKNHYGTFANSQPASFRLIQIPFLDHFFSSNIWRFYLVLLLQSLSFKTDLRQHYSSLYIAMKPWTLQQSMSSF